MLRTSSALLVLATLAACKDPKGVEVDARRLIPADASVAFGFELDPLRNSPIGPMLHASMQATPTLKAMLAAVPACNVDLANLRGVFAAVANAEDSFMAVVESPKIGTEDTVRCLDAEFAKSTGAPSGALRFRTRGDVRATSMRNGDVIAILNENAILMVGDPWEKAVFAAIETGSSGGATTPLTKSIEHVDAKTDLWFAMTTSGSERADFFGIAGADGIEVVTVTTDLSNGVKLEVGFDARHASNARVIATSVQKKLAAVKPGLADAGLPPTLLDTLTVTTNDDHVSGTLDVAKDELPAVVAAMAPFFG